MLLSVPQRNRGIGSLAGGSVVREQGGQLVEAVTVLRLAAGDRGKSRCAQVKPESLVDLVKESQLMDVAGDELPELLRQPAMTASRVTGGRDHAIADRETDSGCCPDRQERQNVFVLSARAANPGRRRQRLNRQARSATRRGPPANGSA